MKRAIYEVYAKVVDSSGAYNTLTGYPKKFDSKDYGNDLEKTLNRARGEYNECLGAMYKVDTRQCQFAMILDASTGVQIAMEYIGKLDDLPDQEA